MTAVTVRYEGNGTNKATVVAAGERHGGAALASGALTPQQVTDDLACTQQFLDRRLNRRRNTERTWPDFPPASVTAFDPDTLPRQWHWT